MRRYGGLRCGACGFNQKTLYGVRMEYEPNQSSRFNEDGAPKPPVISNVNICRRCMRKFGLMEREQRDNQ